MSRQIFNKIEIKSVGSNTFDLSHDRKMTLDMGELVPICVIDTIPGDKFRIQTSQMIRFAPLIAPPMHMVNVYTHFFFVPNRLVWDNWENFITGGEDAQDTSVFPTINIPATTDTTGELADYLGMPKDNGAGNAKISAIPFAAYQLIFKEYFRDQNLQVPIDTDLIDGDNASTYTELTTLRNRAWQHDYFTSALPWTQKRN